MRLKSIDVWLALLAISVCFLFLCAPPAECEDCPYGKVCVGSYECQPNYCHLECRPNRLDPGLGRCG